MTPERWPRVKELFLAAAALPPDRRAGLLEVEPDDRIRGEVAMLLAQHERSGTPLDPPSMLGPWRIVSPIAEGGMASVFLAERADGQFRKTVALKILRMGIIGADAMARFDVERQILAELDHPNIVRLLDGGIAPDHRPWLVMDYVESGNIVDYAAEKRLSGQRSIELFTPICGAASYAHRHRVLHRDIKPGNILITREGVPRLLDFGIAKWLDAEEGRDPTSTVTRRFTALYASPEQIRGEAIDATTDVYSLGVVLFELLSRKTPYDAAGLPPYEIQRRVCEEPLDLSSLAPGIGAVVAKATAKEPAKRFQSVDQMLSAIHDAGLVGRRFFVLTGRRKAALAIGATAVAAAAGLTFRGASPAALPSSRNPVLAGRLLALESGHEDYPDLSNDGSWLVYAGTGDAGRSDPGLRLFRFGHSEPPRRITTESDLSPRWSPDGRRIAFARQRGTGAWSLMVLKAPAGEAVEIAPMQGIHLDWVSNRELIFIDRKTSSDPFAVFLIDTESGKRRQLTSPPAGSWGDQYCAGSPDRSQLAFVRYSNRGRGDVYVKAFDNGTPVRLTHHDSWLNGVAWTPDGGELVYAASGVWRMPVQGGKAVRIYPFGEMPRIRRMPGGGSWKLLLCNRSRPVIMVEAASGESGTLQLRQPLNWAAGQESPAFAPSGRGFAFSSNRLGAFNIWLKEDGSGEARRLSNSNSVHAQRLRWSRDGGRIAYVHHDKLRSSIRVIALASGRDLPLSKNERHDDVPSWSADGEWVYFRSDRSGRNEIWKVRATGAEDPLRVTHGGGIEAQEEPSGGGLLIVKSHDSGPLYRLAPSGAERRLTPQLDITAGFWDVTPSGIYWVEMGTAGNRLSWLDWATRRRKVIGSLPFNTLIPQLSARADARAWLFARQSRRSQIIELDLPR